MNKKRIFEEQVETVGMLSCAMTDIVEVIDYLDEHLPDDPAGLVLLKRISGELDTACREITGLVMNHSTEMINNNRKITDDECI